MAAGVFDRLPEGVAPGDWYMDYRNADGSSRDVRQRRWVFAHYLRASGLESRDELSSVLAGPAPWRCTGGTTPPRTSRSKWKTNQLGPGEAIVGGRPFAGLAIDVGNPHLACVDPDLTLDELAALDIAAPVSFDRTQFPEGEPGTQVSMPPSAWWWVSMRVHERGVEDAIRAGTVNVARSPPSRRWRSTARRRQQTRARAFPVWEGQRPRHRGQQ